MLIGLDTNIIIYALTEQNGEKGKISADILREILINPHRYRISIQVLAEAIYVVSRKTPNLRLEAVRLVKLLSQTVNILYYTNIEIEQASTGPPKHFWDRLLAYTYLNNGVERILTEDERPYRGIIETINPFKE